MAQEITIIIVPSMPITDDTENYYIVGLDLAGPNMSAFVSVVTVSVV